MTEEEWLGCQDPTAMLCFIKARRNMRKTTKQRRQRLAAVACCRRLPRLLADPDCRWCLEVAEDFADGLATAAELRAAEAVANKVWLDRATDEATFALLHTCSGKVDGSLTSTFAMCAADNLSRAEVYQPFRACGPEGTAQCELIRDIFGNPFRPVAFDPVWRTETAVGIARGIYDDRAFERMPILADALQDAGCEHLDSLTHCREPGTHVRGCWVVDLVLGKE